MDFRELPRPSLGIGNEQETKYLLENIDELRYHRGRVVAIRSCTQPPYKDGKTLKTDAYKALQAEARRFKDAAAKLGMDDVNSWLRSQDRITTLFIGAIKVKELF